MLFDYVPAVVRLAMDNQCGHTMRVSRIFVPGLPYPITALIATIMLHQQLINKDVVALRD
jgi:hypothetical protein